PLTQGTTAITVTTPYHILRSPTTTPFPSTTLFRSTGSFPISLPDASAPWQPHVQRGSAWVQTPARMRAQGFSAPGTLLAAAAHFRYGRPSRSGRQRLDRPTRRRCSPHVHPVRPGYN